MAIGRVCHCQRCSGVVGGDAPACRQCAQQGRATSGEHPLCAVCYGDVHRAALPALRGVLLEGVCSGEGEAAALDGGPGARAAVQAWTAAHRLDRGNFGKRARAGVRTKELVAHLAEVVARGAMSGVVGGAGCGEPYEGHVFACMGARGRARGGPKADHAVLVAADMV